jgi:hypothetical protein
VSQLEVHVVETNEKRGVVETRTDSGNDEEIVENRRKSQKIAEKLRKNSRDSNRPFLVALALSSGRSNKPSSGVNKLWRQ